MVGWYHRLNGHEFGWAPGLVLEREAWRAAIHGVSKSRTRLSNSTEQKHMINVQLTHRSRYVHTREKILGDHNSAYHWHICRNFVF